MFYSKILLQQPYALDTVIGEWTSTPTSSITIKGDGIYEVIMVGGGGGGAINQADTYSSAGAGGAGGYFDGLLKLKSSDTITLSIGSGGSGHWYNTYYYSGCWGDSGSATTIYINNTAIITCNGGGGAYAYGSTSGGSCTINDNSRIKGTPTAKSGNNGGTGGGVAYYAYPVADTASFYPARGIGGGSAGGSTTSYRNGVGGAVKIIYKGI